ncbi:MAG: competence protein ComA [Lonepinella koalarum]|nr:competence protein ComA [Lonepinella koalarum]
MLKKRKDTLTQVGLWQNNEGIQTLWFDSKNQPHFWQAADSVTPLQIAKNIATKLTQDNPSLKVGLTFITAISSKHIWSKTLILPHALSSAECEQQCRYVLAQELPVPLDELWFDFCSKPLKQSFRLDIFAVMQSIAKQQVDKFSPLKINVLDTLSHCLLRAFRYFQPHLDDAETLLLYQDGEHSIAIQNKTHQLQLLQTQGNLTALFEQFCERYEEKPNAVIYYRTTGQEILPNNWQEINTELPLIALGAALWQRDFINGIRH